MMLLSFLVVFFLSGAGSLFAGGQAAPGLMRRLTPSRSHDWDILRTGESHDWDILKLTQSWPPGACIFIAQQEDQKCNISSLPPAWVIHGLWPTQSGTLGPNYCNDTWKFELSKIQSLKPELDLNWPSIALGEKNEYTWSHEWEKHGTCGASLAAIRGELLYFNVTMGLHFTHNISRALDKAGITPSDDRGYKPEDVLQVLTESLGATPDITCVKNKTDRRYYLEQVELCLDKTLLPTPCPPFARLLFQSETQLPSGPLADQLRKSNIHDCSDPLLYYKPFPTRPSHGTSPLTT